MDAVGDNVLDDGLTINEDGFRKREGAIRIGHQEPSHISAHHDHPTSSDHPPQTSEK